VRESEGENERVRHVTYLWKVTLAVADQEARLPAAAVADDDNLLGIGGGVGHGCC
jgi:hypothetical protein